MKNVLKIVGFVSALSLFSMSVSAAVTLKLAHAAPESDLQQDLSLFFKKEVEARSNGEIKVNIFPQGQLGSDKQMIDGTRSGIVDISMVGINNWSGLIPESAAFELPYIFPNRESAYAALDGVPGKRVLNDMEKFGAKGLGYPENGFRNITNNKRPIKTPADLNGLRMRVNNAKALNDMFNNMGANPQQIPVSELYTALETGVVDAQDHPIGVTLSFKFYEVQKYLSLSQHAYSPLVIAMNLKKFNRLTPAQQKIITDVVQESIERQRHISIEKEEEMISQLEKEGVKVNRDVDAQAFQSSVKPVWDTFIKENGDRVITEILETQKQ